MERENLTEETKKTETKICKHCQSEIPKKAKVCPNCRKKQGGKGKWIVIAVVVLLVIGAAAGGGDTETTTKTGEVASETADTSASKADTESVEEEQPVDNQFAVGDIVETPNFKISYISASEYTSNNEFIQPKEGNVFYRMEFEFENISSTDQAISSVLSWGCYADGYAAEQSYIGDDQIDVTLSPGKKVKGAVYYEVPQDAKEIILEYETNYWTENKIEFIVK
ncbi:MAG: DUF4352 domain-containing protein [Lachnospiraceae bacterium]